MLYLRNLLEETTLWMRTRESSGDAIETIRAVGVTDLVVDEAVGGEEGEIGNSDAEEVITDRFVLLPGILLTYAQSPYYITSLIWILDLSKLDGLGICLQRVYIYVDFLAHLGRYVLAARHLGHRVLNDGMDIYLVGWRIFAEYVLLA